MKIHFIFFHEKKQTRTLLPLILVFHAKVVNPADLGSQQACSYDWYNAIALDLFDFFEDLDCHLKVWNFLDNIVDIRR